MVNKAFVWLHPAVYLTVFLSPLVFLIVYLVVRKKVRLQVPLCESHRKPVSRMRIATAVLLIGGPTVAALLIVFANSDAAVWGIFLILFTLIGGIITLRLQRPLTAVRIDDDSRVTLRGACETYLSALATEIMVLPL